MNYRVFIMLAMLSGIFTSCKILPGSISGYKHLIPGKDTTLNGETPGEPIQVLYTGSGGLVIRYKQQMLITDPFYSNRSPIKLLFGVKTDKRQVDKTMKMIADRLGPVEQITGVLIAHSHYDHLADLPYLFMKDHITGSDTVYGSESTFNALQFIQPFRKVTFKNIEPLGRIHYPNQYMSVMPVHTAHAPHLGSCTFMEGRINEKGIRGLDTISYRSCMFKWKEGGSYSFIVQIRDPSTGKLFRIYIQSTACAPEHGLPPVTSDSFDLAIIGVASSGNVTDYPETLLKTIKPKYTMLVHWEDFFRDYSKPPKTVRFTNFNKFFNRYERYTSIGRSNLVMPVPGTVIRVWF